MLNMLGQVLHHLMQAMRYVTIKDKSGAPRWIWTGSLACLVGALVATSFMGGALFRGSAPFNKLKTRVKMILSAEALDPVDTWNLTREDSLTLKWQPLETNNMTLERLTIPIATFPGSGGSLTEINGLLTFVTPKGRIGYVSGLSAEATEAEIVYTDMQVPIRFDAFNDSNIAQMPGFNRYWVRTMDSISRPLGDGRYEFFVSHHRYENECFRSVISRTVLETDSTSLHQVEGAGWEQVFESQPCLEMKDTGNLYSGLRDGGRMAFLPNGKLLFSVGDFDFDGDNSPINAPMDLSMSYGKIHEIDLETGESEIYAYGMRNPQGLTVTETGEIFTTEHGPNGGDEVNYVVRDANYGWPIVTLGMAYGFPRRPWLSNPVQGQHDGEGYTLPVFAYVPSIGIGSILEITSPLFPDWKHDLLVASLDHQSLYRLRRNGPDIIYSEQIEIHERLRDSLQLSSGQFAFLTDSAHIILIRPKPRLEGTDIAPPPPTMTLAGYTGVRDVAARQAAEFAALGIHPGSVVFNSKCASCHSIDSPETIVGPSLFHVAGRKVGSIDGYPYSDAMTGRSERWTEARLQRFLSDPDAEFHGTNMSPIHLTLPEYLHVAWWITNCTSGRDRPECHTDG